jgi:signal transduction histidine kinase
VIAHQLAVIAIQAGAAPLTTDSEGQLGSVLSAIEEASRVALADIRRALGVLREPDQGDGVAPQPGLAGLDQLAEGLRRAGLPVDLSTSGDLTGLASGLDVSAYRIVQEALTNVLNHAGAVATQVTVSREVNRLEVDIRNDPPVNVRPAPRGGRGLLGMRERVAAWHGTLDAGPLPDGGFAVTARIPLA